MSYCYLRFNMPTLPDKSLTVAKELSGGGEALNGYLTRALDYRFRVLRPDGSLYVPAGTAYRVLEGTSVTGSGRVDAEGYFTLKAGQMAQFTDMMTLGGGAYDYIVEETMPSRLTGQYEQVQYTVGSGTGTGRLRRAGADVRHQRGAGRQPRSGGDALHGERGDPDGGNSGHRGAGSRGDGGVHGPAGGHGLHRDGDAAGGLPGRL